MSTAKKEQAAESCDINCHSSSSGERKSHHSAEFKNNLNTRLNRIEE